MTIDPPNPLPKRSYHEQCAALQSLNWPGMVTVIRNPEYDWAVVEAGFVVGALAGGTVVNRRPVTTFLPLRWLQYADADADWARIMRGESPILNVQPYFNVEPNTKIP